MCLPEGVAILNCHSINMSVLSRGDDKFVALVTKTTHVFFTCYGANATVLFTGGGNSFC